jgi:hypothetical protein
MGNPGRGRAETVAQPGTWRVASRSDYDAVVVKGKRTNHVFHLILSVVTMGFWLPVWLIVAVLKQEQKYLLTMDGHGNVSTQPAGADGRPMPSTEARWVFVPTTRLCR